MLAALRWVFDGVYLLLPASDAPKGSLLVVRADSAESFRAADPLEARDLILAAYSRRPAMRPLAAGALGRRLDFQRAHPEATWDAPSANHKVRWTDEDGKPQEEVAPDTDAMLRRLRERGFTW